MQPRSEVLLRRVIAGMIVIILVASGCVSGGDSTAADGVSTTTAVAEPSTTTAVAEPSTSVSWNPILATTVAKTAPPAATCPTGSDPSVAGSIDQQRPHPGWVGSLAAAFDLHAGRIVYVDQQGETWTFDVCANRWDQMNPNGSPADPADLIDAAGRPSGVLGSLVYDADSDVTVALNGGYTAVYDANTNTWTRNSTDDSINPFGGAVYDPASGLILTTRTSSESWDLWAYDVDTNTWSAIGTIPGDIPTSHVLDFLGYSQTIDRFIIVGYVDREPATVLLDPRTGETTIVSTDTPTVNLGWPGAVYGQADDTVFVSEFDGGFALCGFDTASLAWTCEKAPVTVPSFYYPFVAAVGDPINDRLVLINGIYGEWWSSAADDVWAIDLDTGEWAQILAPASPEWAPELETSMPAASGVGDGQVVAVTVSGVSGHVGDDLAVVVYEGGELIDLERDAIGGFWSVISGDDVTVTEVVRKPGPSGVGRFPFVSDEALTVEPGVYTLVVWVDDALNPVSRWVPVNTDGRGLFGCQQVFEVGADAQTDVVVSADLQPDGWNTSCTSP